MASSNLTNVCVVNSLKEVVDVLPRFFLNYCFDQNTHLEIVFKEDSMFLAG